MSEVACALNDSLPWLGMAADTPPSPTPNRTLNDSLPWLGMDFSSSAAAAEWRALNGIAPVAMSLPFYPPENPTLYGMFPLAGIAPIGVCCMVLRNEPRYIAERLAALEDRISRTTGQSRAL